MNENQLQSYDFFVNLTRDINGYEQLLTDSDHFKGEMFPFKSPLLQMAFNELRLARMFSGDCLRLTVLGDMARTASRFVPAEHHAVYMPKVYGRQLNEFDFDEKGFIIAIKERLRDLLYRHIDQVHTITDFMTTIGIYDEFYLYRDQVSVHLKQADQYLGLRLGEIAEKAAK